MLKLIFVSIISGSLAIATCSGQVKSSDSDNGIEQFETGIRPLLEQFCIDCHSPGDWKDLDFLGARTENDLAGLRGVYAAVVEQLENRTMPPVDCDQPTDADRKLVTDWIRKTLDLKPADTDRIAQYVVATFEDKKGNLWFGTMHKGASRYDGKTLTWFSTVDGLQSNAATSFAEDKEGNLWIGTQEGICTFDGKTITRFGSDEGLPAGDSRVTADNEGNIWANMNHGVFRYDGSTFIEFKIPIVKKESSSYAIFDGRPALELVDKDGNLWFGTDGYGAFKFDGKTFTHFTKDHGLCSNTINGVLQDQQGNIWFACMQSYQPEMTGDGGVCRYDGSSFSSFPEVAGLSENDIYTIYKTKAGDIWIGATGVGAYRYDGESFTLFSETDRKHWTRNFGLQVMLEDKNGTLWCGFSGGLFRFNGKSFFNVTKDGPWEANAD